MSSEPVPEPSGKNEYDSPTGMFPVFQKLTDIKKFFITRRAIINGECLYKRTRDELSSQGFMGPWAFNTMQSVLCSIPGMITAAVTWLFATENSTVAAAISADPVQQRLYSVLSPLQPPFTLLLVVYAFAYCCLPTGYVTMTNWRAAQRKYLYFDASYAIWPQLIMASCIAIIPLGVLENSVCRILALLAGITFIGAFGLQAVVSAWKIREEMFEYDYLAGRPEMFGLLRDRSYFKFYVLGGFALPIAISLLSSGLYGVSVVLAGLVHRLR